VTRILEGTPCPASRPTDSGTLPTGERSSYGEDPSQWVDRYNPEGVSRGTVVVIHGGFWKAAYGADLGVPLAVDLSARGWTALNVEYRRVGNGGGFPATFDDIHSAINLAEREGPVVTLGHSAGGHLATWAAARQRFDRWAGGVEVTHVLSQPGSWTSLRRTSRTSAAVPCSRSWRRTRQTPSYELPTRYARSPSTPLSGACTPEDDENVPITHRATTSVRQPRRGDRGARRGDRRPLRADHTGTDAWQAVVKLLETIDS
jgi:acetyl esterase/lipase